MLNLREIFDNREFMDFCSYQHQENIIELKHMNLSSEEKDLASYILDNLDYLQNKFKTKGVKINEFYGN